MVGPKMQDFCPRINMLKVFFLNNPAMNYGLSISAEIVPSKSIFYVKINGTFSKKNHLRTSLLETFFSKKIISF